MSLPKISLPRVLAFEWDLWNTNKSWLKHGVETSECEEIFSDKPVYFPDEKHSQIEARYGCFGETNKKRLLSVAFTIRENKIRIVTARDQSKKERKAYELLLEEKGVAN